MVNSDDPYHHCVWMMMSMMGVLMNMTNVATARQILFTGEWNPTHWPCYWRADTSVNMFSLMNMSSSYLQLSRTFQILSSIMLTIPDQIRHGRQDGKSGKCFQSSFALFLKAQQENCLLNKTTGYSYSCSWTQIVETQIVETLFTLYSCSIQRHSMKLIEHFMFLGTQWYTTLWPIIFAKYVHPSLLLNLTTRGAAAPTVRLHIQMKTPTLQHWT